MGKDSRWEWRANILRLFFAWCDGRSLTRPQEITKPILDRYRRNLFHLPRPNGRPLTFASQVRALTPPRGLFRWLTRQNVLLWNPASEIELPKQERRLPKHVLTIDEAERILDLPDVTDRSAYRDRAILETLYSTGIRRMEVIGLRIFDLDADRGTLMVRLGRTTVDRSFLGRDPGYRDRAGSHGRRRRRGSSRSSTCLPAAFEPKLASGPSSFT